MYLDTSPLTNGSHRRIQLRQFKVDTGDFRKRLLDGFHNATCDMLQQLRRHRHLTLQQFVQLCVIEGVFHIVALHGCRHVIAHTQRNSKVRPNNPLLRQNPMKGVDTDIAQIDIRLCHVRYQLTASQTPPYRPAGISSVHAPHRSSTC